VNLAVLDRELAATIDADFVEDLRVSHPLSLTSLEHQRLLAGEDSFFDSILEREG
jgi:hypothetical protein